MYSVCVSWAEASRGGPGQVGRLDDPVCAPFGMRLAVWPGPAGRGREGVCVRGFPSLTWVPGGGGAVSAAAAVKGGYGEHPSGSLPSDGAVGHRHHRLHSAASVGVAKMRPRKGLRWRATAKRNVPPDGGAWPAWQPWPRRAGVPTHWSLTSWPRRMSASEKLRAGSARNSS